MSAPKKEFKYDAEKTIGENFSLVYENYFKDNPYELQKKYPVLDINSITVNSLFVYASILVSIAFFPKTTIVFLALCLGLFALSIWTSQKFVNKLKNAESDNIEFTDIDGVGISIMGTLFSKVKTIKEGILRYDYNTDIIFCIIGYFVFPSIVFWVSFAVVNMYLEKKLKDYMFDAHIVVKSHFENKE